MDQKSLQRLARGGNKVGLGQGKNLLGLDMGASVRAEAEAARQRYGEPEGGRIGIAYQGPNPGRTPFEVNANATLMAFGMNPNLKRFTFLPYARNPETGTGELALPQVGYDFLRDAQMPGEILKGTPVTDQEMQTAAMNIVPSTSTIGAAGVQGLVGNAADGTFAANPFWIGKANAPGSEKVMYSAGRHGKDIDDVKMLQMQEGGMDLSHAQEELNAAINSTKPVPGVFVDDIRKTIIPWVDWKGPNGMPMPLERNPDGSVKTVTKKDGRVVPVSKLNKQQETAKYIDLVQQGLGKETIEDFSPANMQKVAAGIAEEAYWALQRPGNAANWYMEVIDGMQKVVHMLHPETVSNNPDVATNGPLSVYKTALAITSNGITVADNMQLTELVYDFFKREGRMPESVKEVALPGKASKQMYNGFKAYNALLKELGDTESVHEFLMGQYKKSDLEKMTGINISGESANAMVPGSAIFGPKIGAGFWQNLNGNWKPLTADRWWMKTWGRHTGRTSIYQSAKGWNDQKMKFIEFARRDKDFAKKYGVTPAQIKNDPDAIMQIASIIEAEYRAGDFKNKTPLNMSAKNMVEAFSRVAEEPNSFKPGGTKIRPIMRETVDMAIEMLKTKGINLNPAQVQALVWYPEKELWSDILGKAADKTAATDYLTEVSKIAQSRGISPERINAATKGM